jgi:hypothetical protein
MASFATLQDAWGVSSFALPTPPVTKPLKKPFDPTTVRTYSMAPELSSQARLRAYVRQVYADKGVPGVREVLGADIWRRVCGFRQQRRRRKQQQQHARQLQRERREQHRDWSESLDWMWTEPESVILLIIAAFALLVAFDSLRGD